MNSAELARLAIAAIVTGVFGIGWGYMMARSNAMYFRSKYERERAARLSGKPPTVDYDHGE